MVFQNLPLLAQLKIDLASSEMMRWHSRPIGEMTAQSSKKWLKIIKEQLAGGLPSYETLKGGMVRVGGGRDKDTGLKELPKSPWLLAVPSFQH